MRIFSFLELDDDVVVGFCNLHNIRATANLFQAFYNTLLKYIVDIKQNIRIEFIFRLKSYFSDIHVTFTFSYFSRKIKNVNWKVRNTQQQFEIKIKTGGSPIPKFSRGFRSLKTLKGLNNQDKLIFPFPFFEELIFFYSKLLSHLEISP